MRVLMRTGAWLVVPLVLLLAAQWPLREWIHAHARTANDFGQIVFGLYVALALGHATSHHAHLRAMTQAQNKWPRMFGHSIVLLWSAGIFAAALLPAWRATLAHEHFTEGMSPGYFLLRWALVALAAIQCILQARQLQHLFTGRASTQEALP